MAALYFNFFIRQFMLLFFKFVPAQAVQSLLTSPILTIIFIGFSLNCFPVSVKLIKYGSYIVG